MLTSPEIFAESLHDCGDIKLLRIAHLAGKRVIFYFDWQGNEISFTADIAEVIKGDIPEFPRSRKGDMGNVRHGLESKLVHKKWDEHELRREKLPLYWSEEWLKNKYAELGSYTAIQKQYGYDETTMSGHAQAYHDWSPKKENANKKENLLTDFATGKYTMAELAKKYGVGKATAWRWVKGYEQQA